MGLEAVVLVEAVIILALTLWLVDTYLQLRFERKLHSDMYSRLSDDVDSYGNIVTTLRDLIEN